MIKTLAKLFDNSIRTVSNWKNENRPIIRLIEKYFSKEEIEEFLQTGQIKKFEINDENKYKNDSLSLINKLNLFDLGSLVALYLLMTNKENLIFDNKLDCINFIKKNLSLVKINISEDKFASYFDQKDLIKYINLFLNDEDIAHLFSNKHEMKESLNYLIKSKKGVLKIFDMTNNSNSIFKSKNT